MRFISGYRELFPDIGKLNSRYQKIIPYFPISEIRIPDIGKSFPDIGNYFPISENNSRYREMMNKNPNGFPYNSGVPDRMAGYGKPFGFLFSISRYREIEFPISGNRIPDIGK